MMISKKKGAACKQRHAHQATGNTGGRGKCSRYYYYRPIHEKSLVFFLFFIRGTWSSLSFFSNIKFNCKIYFIRFSFLNIDCSYYFITANLHFYLMFTF